MSPIFCGFPLSPYRYCICLVPGVQCRDAGDNSRKNACLTDNDFCTWKSKEMMKGEFWYE